MVCTARAAHAAVLQAAAAAAGEPLAIVGVIGEGDGVRAVFDGAPVGVDRLGYAHR